MNIGTKLFKQRLDARLIKKHDVIDGTQRRNKASASFFIENRTAGTFQCVDARIPIYADHENIPFPARALEIANVTDVERIETAIGKDDALTALLVFRQFSAEPFSLDDFRRGATHILGGGPASLVANGGEKFIACNGSGAALHNNKASGDVGDVRGFQRRTTASKRKRVGSKDSVACAGDVNGLVASINGYLRQPVIGFKERHAIASASDEEGAEFHFGKRR